MNITKEIFDTLYITMGKIIDDEIRTNQYSVKIKTVSLQPLKSPETNNARSF